MQKITPFLWFDGNAEEAMDFYTSIFKDSKVNWVSRYGEGGMGPKGSVMTGTFTLNGQEFMALNGGPMFEFTPAISFFINCDTQEEVDFFWNKFSEGGSPSRCGWVTDKFGVSWQVVPRVLGELMHSSDKGVSNRVMQAMLTMDKLDIAGLEAAAKQ